MLNNSVFLDVDPSIIERNLMLTMESEVDEELKNRMFNTSTTNSKLVKPFPGFCVKTYLMGVGKKIFINVCYTDSIPAPENITNDELLNILGSEEPSKYRIPMSIGEGRDETDKSGQPATAYDIAINPKFLEKVEKNELFQSFFLNVAFEGLQDKYQMEINMEKYVILKNRKSVGPIQSHRIQIRNPENQSSPKIKPLIEEIKSLPHKDAYVKSKDTNVTPKPSIADIEYRLHRKSTSKNMHYLIGEFKIPSNVYMKDLRLDVGQDRIILECHNNSLDIFVPFKINPEDVHAQLDRNIGILYVEMATL